MLLVLLVPGGIRAQEINCTVAQSAIEVAGRIRGLSLRKPVPCAIQDRDQVRDFLIHAVQHKIPAEKMRFDERIAKALGFIPEDYDYKDGLINLYLSQLGGYYDPEKKRYVMAGWLPAVMQPPVAVHELTHALQDQHYNLETFIDDINFSTDRLLARAALVEGDATAVMLDYQRELMQQVPLSQIEKVDSFVLQTILGMALSTSQDRVPESLKAALLFPYASGIRFVHSLLRKGGYAEVSRAFVHPPASTEEILHPEKFRVAGSESSSPADQDFSPLLKGERIKYGDTLGEFSIAALLSGSSISKERAAVAAAGWGGDRVVVAGPENRESIFWITRWDTKEDAQEFYDCYREFLTIQGSAVQQAEDSQIQIRIDSRLVRLELQGQTVTAVVQFPESGTPAT